jgi:hypothetical protein
MTLPRGCPPASVERMCRLAGVSRVKRDWTPARSQDESVIFSQDSMRACAQA